MVPWVQRSYNQSSCSSFQNGLVFSGKKKKRKNMKRRWSDLTLLRKKKNQTNKKNLRGSCSIVKWEKGCVRPVFSRYVHVVCASDSCVTPLVTLVLLFIFLYGPFLTSVTSLQCFTSFFWLGLVSQFLPGGTYCFWLLFITDSLMTLVQSEARIGAPMAQLNHDSYDADINILYQSSNLVL